MKQYLIENTIKNSIITILLLVLYKPIVNLFRAIDDWNYDSLLITITLLIMAVLFADYAFSYSHTRMKSAWHRFLSHGITFIIMLCTGLMLEAVSVIIQLKTDTGVWLIDFVAIAFYISLVMYDFWDISRAKNDRK